MAFFPPMNTSLIKELSPSPWLPFVFNHSSPRKHPKMKYICVAIKYKLSPTVWQLFFLTSSFKCSKLWWKEPIKKAMRQKKRVSKFFCCPCVYIQVGEWMTSSFFRWDSLKGQISCPRAHLHLVAVSSDPSWARHRVPLGKTCILE